MPPALGIDIGATKIACAVVNEDGSMAGSIVVEPTGSVWAEETAGNVFRAMDRALAEREMTASELAGIGIGSAGPIDPEGTYGDVDTLPHMHGYALGRAVRQRYGHRPAVDNDANCFALAEAAFGAGRGEAIVVGITLGTGLGCGIVVDGRIFAGTTGNAGEVGRCLVDGLMYDQALSGSGVAGVFRELTGEDCRAEQVQARAEKGEERAAAEAWRVYGARLGAVLGVMAAVLDPGVIVLGGSVAAGFPWFGSEAEARMREQLSTPAAQRVRLCRGALGPRAGCLGAAALALR